MTAFNPGGPIGVHVAAGMTDDIPGTLVHVFSIAAGAILGMVGYEIGRKVMDVAWQQFVEDDERDRGLSR